jgi:hypothetical protein
VNDCLHQVINTSLSMPQCLYQLPSPCFFISFTALMDLDEKDDRVLGLLLAISKLTLLFQDAKVSRFLNKYKSNLFEDFETHYAFAFIHSISIHCFISPINELLRDLYIRTIILSLVMIKVAIC